MPKAAPLPASPDVDVCSDELVWDGRFPVQRIKFRNRRFDGTMSGIRTWELWRRGKAAALLPYDPVADAVVLIEQFRLPALAAGVDPIQVEIPAGLVDDGEDVAHTLIREVREEIGLQPGRLVPVGRFLLTAGGSDEYVYISIGEVVVPAHDRNGLAGFAGLASEDEDIRIRVWPASKAIASALDGEISNSVAAIALLWLAAKREQIRAAWGQAG